MKNIAVIGSGTMGNGIAHVFAQFGYAVSLIDINADALKKANATIAKNLQRQQEKGLITKEESEKALERISLHTVIEQGVANADLVIEAATENVDLKLSIFKTLEEKAPATAILASNTSSISITR